MTNWCWCNFCRTCWDSSTYITYTHSDSTYIYQSWYHQSPPNTSSWWWTYCNHDTLLARCEVCQGWTWEIPPVREVFSCYWFCIASYTDSIYRLSRYISIFLTLSTMPIFWLLSLLFGIIVIANPDLIAYIVGFTFVFIWLNTLVAAWMLSRGKWQAKNSWKVGGYEIIKNRK